MSSAYFKLFIILVIFLGLIAYLLLKLPINKPKGEEAPKPSVVSILGRQKVKYPQDYTIVMLGDSMTEVLGNSDELKKFLSSYYPDKSFEVLNYGFGATNILSAMDRISQETEHGRKFRPIEEIAYDLILIESFGQNPLSEYPLDEGLKLQSEELQKIINRLKATNPDGKIVLVATISPNSKIFAQNQVDLSAEKRQEWVEERVAYIKNHIAFAKANHLPLVNIFEKSLLENGDGNADLISTQDFIHPSPEGIVFISHEIADFIYNNAIFSHGD